MHPRDFLVISIVGIFVYTVVRVFDGSLKWLGRVVVNGVAGLAALWLWDRIFGYHHWAVGLNPVTGTTLGLLGPAGFILLVAAKVLIL